MLHLHKPVYRYMLAPSTHFSSIRPAVHHIQICSSRRTACYPGPWSSGKYAFLFCDKRSMGSSLMSPEERAKFESSLNAGGWQGVWETLQPGQAFDAGRMSPVVSNKLQSGELDVKGKTCLVPGCGRGYDVVEFVKAGATASIGLEIAPTAVAQANEYKNSCGLDAETAEKASIIDADFFTYTPPGGSAHVGYDYTFLCALPPEKRQDWAQGWARLIAPGGELVTMMFPVDPEKQGGPPYAVSHDLYTELLTPVGFSEISVEKVPEELSHPGRGGKEYFGRWRKQ